MGTVTDEEPQAETETHGLVEFVEKLLSDWEVGQERIWDEWGVYKAERDELDAEIVARRAKWAAIKARLAAERDALIADRDAWRARVVPSPSVIAGRPPAPPWYGDRAEIAVCAACDGTLYRPAGGHDPWEDDDIDPTICPRGAPPDFLHEPAKIAHD